MTVADEWQGRGLGTALLARLVERAAAEGHVALRADVLAVNARSIAILRRAGFRLREHGGTLLELELDLPPGAPSENGGQARRGAAGRSRAPPRRRSRPRRARAPRAISATMLSVSGRAARPCSPPAGAG